MNDIKMINAVYYSDDLDLDNKIEIIYILASRQADLIDLLDKALRKKSEKIRELLNER